MTAINGFNGYRNRNRPALFRAARKITAEQRVAFDGRYGGGLKLREIIPIPARDLDWSNASPRYNRPMDY